MAEKPLLKSYKVKKRIGWEGKVYLPEETITMTEEWAAFYVANEVLSPVTSTANAPSGSQREVSGGSAKNLAKKEGEQ